MPRAMLAELTQLIGLRAVRFEVFNHPIDAEGHGHHPKGVSSCPVGLELNHKLPRNLRHSAAQKKTC
jgi:hypothetical protein